MKRLQQLTIHALLSSTAILVAQAAWADAVQINNVIVDSVDGGLRIILETDSGALPEDFAETLEIFPEDRSVRVTYPVLRIFVPNAQLNPTVYPSESFPDFKKNDPADGINLITVEHYPTRNGVEIAVVSTPEAQGSQFTVVPSQDESGLMLSVNFSGESDQVAAENSDQPEESANNSPGETSQAEGTGTPTEAATPSEPPASQAEPPTPSEAQSTEGISNEEDPSSEASSGTNEADTGDETNTEAVEAGAGDETNTEAVTEQPDNAETVSSEEAGETAGESNETAEESNLEQESTNSSQDDEPDDEPDTVATAPQLDPQIIINQLASDGWVSDDLAIPLFAFRFTEDDRLLTYYRTASGTFNHNGTYEIGEQVGRYRAIDLNINNRIRVETIFEIVESQGRRLLRMELKGLEGERPTEITEGGVREFYLDEAVPLN